METRVPLCTSVSSVVYSFSRKLNQSFLNHKVERRGICFHWRRKEFTLYLYYLTYNGVARQLSNKYIPNNSNNLPPFV